MSCNLIPGCMAGDYTKSWYFFITPDIKMSIKNRLFLRLSTSQVLEKNGIYNYTSIKILLHKKEKYIFKFVLLYRDSTYYYILYSIPTQYFTFTWVLFFSCSKTYLYLCRLYFYMENNIWSNKKWIIWIVQY